MKHLILSALIVLGAATSANALIIGDDNTTSSCTGNVYEKDAAICLISITTSFPTMIVGADFNEMNESEIQDFAHAEAQNYLDGVEGDYLLLKKTAEAMDQSVDQVAHDLVNAKTEKN